MLDVYRNYYGLTGEPFRLGPDYRFSLHHESYANAKAYLEYAIYQGEGFIAITGGPGTGKTTLISEILAGLDREKIQVATLTSTQLESRDLLYMVASSFDLHPADSSKANLLVEIEAFLVRKIRDGQRAILIVDEAQGLSTGALEELRLLANLQYQYQLLLQIFLVGQEQLLGLIRAPGMEHLHQRLVAATALEPLSFDETIDYIEHRLTKVGWHGSPEIDESALREIYRYSGGIPRRINLIANRLFLYGGMAKKLKFDADDMRDVVQGLIQEFLLAPEPLVAETDIAAASGSKGEGRSRSLPRNDRAASQEAPPPLKTRDMPKVEATPGPTEKGRDSATPAPAAISPESARKNEAAPAAAERPPQQPHNRSAARAKTRPVAAPKPSPSIAPTLKKKVAQMERPVPTRPVPGASQKPDKKNSSKGIVVAVFLLAGAGAGYLLREQASDQAQVYKPVEPATESMPQIAPAPEPRVEKEAGQASDGLPAENDHAGIIVESAGEAALSNQRAPKTVDRGEIIREPSSEPVDAVAKPADGVVKTKPQPVEAPQAQAVTAEPVVQAKPQAVPPIDEAAAEPPKPVQTQPAPVVTSQVEEPRQVDKNVKPATAQPDSNKVESTVSAEPAKPVERLAKADTAVSKPETTSVEAQREQLRAAAEQRFSVRQAQVQTKAPPVAKKPEKQLDAVPAKPIIQSAALSKPTPAIKEPRLTPNEIAAALLDGRWSSSGKPASLLPSETTFCNRQVDKISCLSVPQNVKTQYGLALYKVETTLSGFSEQGHFEMLYRTLVKLANADAARGDSEDAASDNSGWQITAYSMSCKLVKKDQVSCLDGKGIRREYRQTGLRKNR